MYSNIHRGTILQKTFYKESVPRINFCTVLLMDVVPVAGPLTLYWILCKYGCTSEKRESNTLVNSDWTGILGRYWFAFTLRQMENMMSDNASPTVSLKRWCSLSLFKRTTSNFNIPIFPRHCPVAEPISCTTFFEKLQLYLTVSLSFLLSQRVPKWNHFPS